MSTTAEELVEAAELAVFERRSLALRTAAAAGLEGLFESFHTDGLRVSMATADPYEYLNTVEGVNERSVESLPKVLEKFPDPSKATVVATSPSLSLIEQLLREGYEQAAARPIAYLHRFGRAPAIGTAGWQIREVSTKEDASLFTSLLVTGYSASTEVEALLREEHLLPSLHGFIAFRNREPLAAAAMSFHPTGSVLGGSSTLPEARGTGAQTALLAHRLRRARAFAGSLVAATAAPGSPSIRNLSRMGFTIVERTAWHLNS